MRFAQRNRPVFQASIARQHEANLVAQPRQFNRKRADDIGETAGFGQWHRLAGEHENLHVYTLGVKVTVRTFGRCRTSCPSRRGAR